MPRYILLAAVAMILPAASAIAETPLASLSGQWAGRGTDRETPMQQAQPARCSTTIQASATRLASETRCASDAGLSKRIHLDVAMDGARISGSAEQTSRTGNGPETRRAGTVTGSRDGDTASYTVRFPGLTPNAHVTVRLVSPTTFSMRVTVLGATLTDVTFHRPAR